MKRTQPVRLIVIDSSVEAAEALLNEVRQGGYPARPLFVHDAETLSDAIRNRIWDVVLLATDAPSLPGRAALGVLNEVAHDVPVIAVTNGTEAGSEALDLLRAGASDVIERDQLPRLQYAVSRELERLESKRQLRDTKLELHRTEQRYRKLVHASPHAIAFVQAGVHLYANEAYATLFGFPTARMLIDLPVIDIVAPEDRSDFSELLNGLSDDQMDTCVEITGLHCEGSEERMQLRLSPVRFEGKSCVQINAWPRFQSEKPFGSDEVSPLRDPVTGFHERVSFERLLAKALEVMDGRLVLVELEDLSRIRKRFGIPAANRIVLETAVILDGKAPPEALLGSFTDGRFGIFLPDSSSSELGRLSSALREMLGNRICELGDRSITVSARVGVVPVCRDDMRRFDAVLDRIRQISRSDVAHQELERMFSAESGRAAVGSSFVQTIDEAIDSDRLSLLFQPIVRLKGEPLELYEVFARITDHDGNPLRTEDFFQAIRHEPGLSRRIDDWVLEKAIRVLRQRQHQGYDTHFFAKLSSESIRAVETSLTLRRLLKVHDVPPKRLILEINEVSANTDVKYARAFVKSLSELGCPTALEHFGTGLTSFKVLQHLPVDYLKIDGSLIKTVVDHAESRELVRSIVKRARGLGKYTIAECLEKAEALQCLFDCGVDFAQGYYIQEPSEALGFDFFGQ